MPGHPRSGAPALLYWVSFSPHLDTHAATTIMFWTNVFLALSFAAMVAIFVWLFRDGEGPSPGPAIMRKRGHDTDDDQSAGED